MVKRKFILLLLSHCCDIAAASDMSAVRYVVAGKRSYITCMKTREDNISVEMAGKRFVKDTNMIRSRFVEILRNSTKTVEDGKN